MPRDDVTEGFVRVTVEDVDAETDVDNSGVVEVVGEGLRDADHEVLP